MFINKKDVKKLQKSGFQNMIMIDSWKSVRKK